MASLRARWSLPWSRTSLRGAVRLTIFLMLGLVAVVLVLTLAGAEVILWDDRFGEALLGLLGIVCGFIALLVAELELAHLRERLEERESIEGVVSTALEALERNLSASRHSPAAPEPSSDKREMQRESVSSRSEAMGQPVSLASSQTSDVEGETSESAGRRPYDLTHWSASQKEPAEQPPPEPSHIREPALDSSALVSAWQDYLEQGDGRFDQRGLLRHIQQAGIEAQVLHLEDLGARDSVLGIKRSGAPEIYLLPNFTKPARAVAEWFTDQGSGERTARIRRLLEVAVVETGGATPRLIKKGVVA